MIEISPNIFLVFLKNDDINNLTKSRKDYNNLSIQKYAALSKLNRIFRKI